MNNKNDNLKEKAINRDQLKDISGAIGCAADNINIFDDLKGERIMQDELRKISGGSNAKDIKYKINADDCISCGLCLSNCPEGAIKEEKGVYTIGEKCTGCGACASGCPVGAI